MADREDTVVGSPRKGGASGGVIPDMIYYHYYHDDGGVTYSSAFYNKILDMIRDIVRTTAKKLDTEKYNAALRMYVDIEDQIWLEVDYFNKDGDLIDRKDKMVLYSAGFGEELFDKLVDDIPTDDIAVLDSTRFPRNALIWLWDEDIVTGLNALVDLWERE